MFNLPQKKEKEECSYFQTVTANGLITRTSVETMMQRGSSGHQQTAHFGAVTLKHSHTFMTLQQIKNTEFTTSTDSSLHPDTGDRLHLHLPPGQRL